MCLLYFSANKKLQEINAVLYLMQETNREMVIFIQKKQQKTQKTSMLILYTFKSSEMLYYTG